MKNKTIIIYHHLDLGDNIMCHGIVREYCKKYQKVAIFSYPHNYPSVSFMYKDLNNLEIIQGNREFAKKFIEENIPNKYDYLIKIGFDKLNWNSDIPLEKQFYDIAGVDLSKKWDNFKIERNLSNEQIVFEKVSKKQDYVFVHEDKKRRFLINKKKINEKYNIFTPEQAPSKNFFDYIKIIENAKEIHVIDSCFMFLVDCLEYKNPHQKLFVHRYSRENEVWKLPILRKDWVILNKEDKGRDWVMSLMTWLYKSNNNNLFERILRKINKITKLQFNQQTKSKPSDLVRRYAFGRTFIDTSNTNNKNQTISIIAKESGAVESKEENNYDIVFYSNTIQSEDLFNKLNNVCKEILIINIFCLPNIVGIKKLKIGNFYIPTKKQVERLLRNSGFEILEKITSGLKKSFVCKKTSNKKID